MIHKYSKLVKDVKFPTLKTLDSKSHLKMQIGFIPLNEHSCICFLITRMSGPTYEHSCISTTTFIY